MAGDFTFTNPEAAKQAIARLQLQAALAENQSREAIAREQAASNRYATQSQLNENEKNRALSREDIASRERIGTGRGSYAAANERANTQYQTVLGEIDASGSDPMTKRELEARMAQFPQLTDDLKENLRSKRDVAYRMAKSAYDIGEQRAANYRTELAGKKPGDYALEGIYKKIGEDKNVAFNRATSDVQSAFPKPREDPAVTPSGLGSTGQSIAPAQDYGGAASSSVPTIGQMKARVTGAPAGAPVAISPAQDYGGAAPMAVAAPVMSSGLYGPPNNSGYDAAIRQANQPRVSDFELYGPPNSSGGYDREIRSMPTLNPYQPIVTRNPFGLGTSSIPVPQAPIAAPSFMDMSQPTRMPTAYELYGPPNRSVRSTDFAPQFPHTLPRLWDIQNIRPEFRPPLDDYYYHPLQ